MMKNQLLLKEKGALHKKVILMTQSLYLKREPLKNIE